SNHSTVPFHKSEAKGQGEMSRQNPDVVGQYNCKDVKATDEIFLDLVPRIKAMGLWDLYIDELLPTQKIACAALRKRGVYVDPMILEQRGMTLPAEVDALERVIQDVTWPGFNPGTNSA